MEELSVHCWGFIPSYDLESNQIVSMKNEEDAQMCADLFPDAIYFFADSVPHPNS